MNRLARPRRYVRAMVTTQMAICCADAMTNGMRPDSPLVQRTVSSPNHGERRGSVNCVILHYTGMADDASALAWLCNPASEVSCHYYVREDGEVLQLVPEARRAWHAGRSSWRGETDINSHSIGIEIVNPGHAGGLPPFPQTQIEAVIALCRDIARRHGISPPNFLAHSDIAPGRKQDPGERFPWKTIHRHGIGHWVVPPAWDASEALAIGDTGTRVVALQTALAGYGYGLAITGTYDSDTIKVVAAFQRHFHPVRVDGVADAATTATLTALLAHLPKAAA